MQYHTQVRDRKVAIVLIGTTKSFGHDSITQAINKGTIACSRKMQVLHLLKAFEKEFHPNKPLTAHCDRKLLEDLTSNKHFPILTLG